MKSFAFLTVLALLLTACQRDFHQPSREVVLPSGKTIKVTEFHLAWADEHGPQGDHDSFDLEYVSSNPAASEHDREAEAREVFELIRPAAELWKLKNASVAGFPTTNRKGKYDLYVFHREPDDHWSLQHIPRKVFSTD